jgi:serine/threonine-protein kinase HipA
MAVTSTKKDIGVYADWVGLKNGPGLLGILSSSRSRGNETFSFEYAQQWIDSGFSQMLDPDLRLYSTGAFYPRDEKPNFGMFLDSSPDRWGRILMRRREAALAKMEERPLKTLSESDFLLGVYDQHRMGALRFKLAGQDDFLNDNQAMAAPPFTSLRELEQASLRFEEDNREDPDYLKWINLLIAPGASLGGARPKASVADPHNHLWIAKFPSRNDDKDIAAWEMLVNELAVSAGVNVAEGAIRKFNNKYHTYLTKRFDRTADGGRIHFASAMTLLGYTDGDNAAGSSYIELAGFIIKHGANPAADLEELWRRIVFNICVKNTDDHLRNHGFLLTDTGWVLSPAYDINPDEYGEGLHLNISQDDNSLDLQLAETVAPHFRVPSGTAAAIIDQVQHAVGLWKEVAGKYKIPRAAQERMERAFTV